MTTGCHALSLDSSFFGGTSAATCGCGRKCCFQKPDGATCQAACTASGDYCFFHDPAREAERKAAGAKGGKRSRKRPVLLPIDAEDVPLGSVADVTNALAVTFNEVRKGQLDSRTGNCLGLLAGQLLRALQGSELADEIEELTREIAEIKRANGNTPKTSEDTASRSDGDPAAGDSSDGALAL